MISKQPIQTNRIRKISGSFSWIDHRILSTGFLESMSIQEIVLYFFLILVGDKNGISFYHYDKVCKLLKINLDEYIQARNQLIKKSLVAYDQSKFQVLELPSKSNDNDQHVDQTMKHVDFQALKDILRHIQ